MTTTTITVPDDTAGQIKRNAEIAWKSLSIHMAAAVSIGASVLLALGPDWVTTFIASHPVLAPAAPFVALAFVVLAKLVPQNIQTAGDKQAADQAAAATKQATVVAFFVDLIGRAFPGQRVEMPAEVASALGLSAPVIVTPPSVPAAIAPVAADPVPAPTAVMPVAAPSVVAPSLVAAAPAAMPTSVDVLAVVRAKHPDWNDAQVTAAVQAVIDRLLMSPPKA